MISLLDFDREYARRIRAIDDAEYDLAEFRVRHFDGDQSELSAKLAKARADLIYFRDDPDKFLPKPDAVTRSNGSQEVTRNADGTVTITGYGSITGHAYPVDDGWRDKPYTEVIERGAFKESLLFDPSVELQFGHDGEVLASTTDGTLLLHEDDHGLAFFATVRAEDAGLALFAPQCSIAFHPLTEDFDEATNTRHISSAWLDKRHIALVPDPANSMTSVGFNDEEVRAARLEKLFTAIDSAFYASGLS